MKRFILNIANRIFIIIKIFILIKIFFIIPTFSALSGENFYEEKKRIESLNQV